MSSSLFPSLADTLAFALAQNDDAVGRPACEGFLGAVRPEYPHGIDVSRLPQTEVGARVVAAQVTGARVDLSQPAPLPGDNRDLGTVGVAFQGRVDGADHEPVTLLRRHISEKAGRTC